VAYTYNLIYSGGRDQEDQDLMSALGKNLARPHLSEQAAAYDTSYKEYISKRLSV
jgi:hypothetical protein